MKNLINIIIFLVTMEFSYAQRFEIGPAFSYEWTNIANSSVVKGKAVIGNAIWIPSYGISSVYYFSEAKEGGFNGIQFEFLKNQRGSQSEQYSDSKILINANSYNLLYKRGGNLGDEYIGYIKIGFGYNTLNNSSFYEGRNSQYDAFNENLREELVISATEFAFVFGMGCEKKVFKNNFKLFIEVNGDAGISKINDNSGSYRTQTLGIGAGIRYIIKSKEKKQ